jgi:bis(5'-nucleosyl)-tetraphosphatase (symmetrical)
MPRHEYVVGDLQGCFAALQALKAVLQFDETQDRLWFAGDLVARGEDSLATLRDVKRLCDLGAAKTVLGNHDLNLLAVWRGYNKRRPRDLTAPIFEADDCADLLDWLRHQPLCLRPNAQTVLTHAGLPPQWSVAQAQQLAAEVEHALQGDWATLDTFLSQMYGESPDLWDDTLTGAARLRTITNYLTRMRLCTAEGRLEFAFKDGLTGDMPTGFAPWFDWPTAQPRRETVLFGHWAALEGAVQGGQVCPLDGGCVWGGALLAYRLSDGQRFKSSEGCRISVQMA